MFAAMRMILIFVIFVGIAGGLWHISNLKADLAVSQQNEEKLTSAIQTQKETIESMKKDIAAIQKANEELKKENEAQKKDVDALSRKFDKRDFGAFASSNVEKAQKLIDRGVAYALRCLELASGAPLNETEKSAKTPLEANRECPSLINPAYTAPTN